MTSDAFQLAVLYDRFAAALRGFGPIGLLAILIILAVNAIIVPLGAVLVLVWAPLSRTPGGDRRPGLRRNLRDHRTNLDVDVCPRCVRSRRLCDHLLESGVRRRPLDLPVMKTLLTLLAITPALYGTPAERAMLAAAAVSQV